MAWATGFFGLTWEKMVENSAAVDTDGDTLKEQLHTNTGTPNFETWDFHNDLTDEVAGTGYSAGGVTVTGVTSGIASGTYTFDGSDGVWASSTITFRGDAFVDTTPGSTTTNWLFLARTFGGDFTTSAGTATVQQAAGGIWTAAYR